MTRIRSMQQDDWDDAFWNSNHEHRKAKAKARKARHKGLNSSTIREGIQDYFEKSKLKKSISEQYQKPDAYEDLDNSDYKPRI